MRRSGLLIALCSIILAVGLVRDALACACCTNIGQRNVGTERLDPYKLGEITQLRFAGEAQLFTGEADPSDVRGIATPAPRYDLAAAWQNDRLTFSLRDQSGRAGTLTLPRPATVSVFEVDPRVQASEGGSGPALYKEWKLSAKPTGTGIFAVGIGPSQLLTLILQGRGNSCTTAADFAHWTLVMQGPKANYSLFGDLVPAL